MLASMWMPMTTEAGGGDVCEESGGTVAILGVEALRRGTIGPFQGGGNPLD